MCDLVCEPVLDFVCDVVAVIDSEIVAECVPERDGLIADADADIELGGADGDAVLLYDGYAYCEYAYVPIEGTADGDVAPLLLYVGRGEHSGATYGNA